MLFFLIFLQNFSERQILWSLCSVVFHALTLKLPIQTSLSVAPELPVSLSSHEKCEHFRKTSPPLGPPLICDVFPRVYQIFRLGLEAALSPETESQNLNWLLLVRTTLFGSRPPTMFAT